MFIAIVLTAVAAFVISAGNQHEAKKQDSAKQAQQQSLKTK